MRTLSLVWTALGLSLFILSMVPESAEAQGSPVRIRKIRTTRTQPIADSGGTKRWAEVRVEYDTAPRWIDEMEVTYYVLLEDKDDSKDPFKLFKGTVNNVNIKKGSNHWGAMWMHPDTLDRYGKLLRVAVVMKVDGRTVGMQSEPQSEERWWERLSPREGLLYNRYQLPQSDDDKFPAVTFRR